MGFTTSYMQGFNVVRRRVWDADPEDTAEFEVLEGGFTEVTLSRGEHDAAHKYILRNNTLTASYYSAWEEERELHGGVTELVDVWIKQRVHSEILDMSNPDEHDTILLSNSPSLTCKRYCRMTAYENHYKVDDDYSRGMNTFDCGVACFESNPVSAGAGKDYVGILQDILVLDYGDLMTPITLFSVQWKKTNDNHGRSTYVRDSDGFLVVNFKHDTPRTVEPYVFPSQCTQVFFADDDLHPRGSDWRVILRKEARSRRMVEEDDDICISMNVAESGAVSSSALQFHSPEPDLTGAIVLNESDNAEALQGFEKLIKRKRPQLSALRNESANRTRRRRFQ
ncbi:hypothetical protein M758_UG088300 [Ceratodon purpureus]|nr:hypothetical protein M758_UG088300 [Ceratodon purpureus]